MPFVVKKNPKFSREINAASPDGGKGAFTVNYTYIPDEELNAATAAESAAAQAHLAAALDAVKCGETPDENPPPRARHWLEIVIESIEGVVDEAGSALSVAEIVAVPWLIGPLSQGYRMGAIAAAEKN